MKHIRRLAPMALTCLLASSSALAAGANSDEALRQFDELLNEQWQYQLRETPDLATTIGDTRYNDRWSDYSLQHVQETRTAVTDFLKRFRAVNPLLLDDQRKISRAMMIDRLKMRLKGILLKTYEMPVDQVEGIQLFFPGFVSSIPFETTKNYEDYLARLHALPAALTQITAVLRQGEKDGLMPPRYLLEKSAEQTRQIAEPMGENNVFGQPVLHFPGTISVAERARLHDVILQAVDKEVRPAYAQFAQFLKTEYAPKGRSQEGIWALPNGTALYRYDVRLQTTSRMAPVQIHQLGLEQVARIEREMTEIAHKLGFADLAALRASVDHDPKLYAHSRDEIVEKYRGYIAQMWPQLPRLFNHIPKTKLEVRPVEQYREADAPGAEYHQGTPDGARPGIVFVNTGDYAKRDLYTIEDTAYHEGVPGHHFQISTAQILPLPPFRQQGDYNAYIEGWALYAEGLGKELGFYQNAYSDYGRLNGELLRADRLVLDTGVHDKHWTRAQMIAFFHAHPPTNEPDMQAETDRYIAWPGQALGYMLGQQTILKLRAHAQKELGAKFDIRAFHDIVLSGGAMPLDMLSMRVEEWIKKTKAG
ncbi:DUF885 domain-containing protein [Kozakia baliensis]|uniref:DUF885 domain-containing protein n=1 Tax=Kozakia baliensis TaxID=153496 RepID=UPI00087988CA|nr:DUF885 family protein [Kozakia baliensis]AOX20804.1 hypothetical protein A0U90_11545 [Kozakia baliensis]